MKSKTWELTVGNRQVNFIQRHGETFDEALERGAAKLGYRGGAWKQPNFHMNHMVSVCDRARRVHEARSTYNGVCFEVA